MAEEMENDCLDNEENNTSVEMPGHGSFSSYISEGYKVIMQGVKTSGGLPSGRNYQFYQTYSNFREKMKDKVHDIHDVMEDMLQSQGIKRSVHDSLMEDAVDTMMFMNDKMLDRATGYMDLMEGVKLGLTKLVQEVSGSWNKPKKKDKIQNFTLSIKKNIPRPQFTFKEAVDNSNSLWEPKITEKHNAIKPLSILLKTSDDGDEYYTHPYEYELELFNVPDCQLARVKKLSKPLALDKTPFTHVDTDELLTELIEHLNQQKAFAVDLEHHGYRSFMGFTCLMQISTKERDFIIDALSLRHSLHRLNDVFTKPNILKVFHGADSDILWLQKDFNVYVVNMFDTYRAAKLLNFPKLSLAYLLNYYCKVDANKCFQLFDWRTRPLPETAINYAKEDTHYLLYIAEIMTNQLIDKANGNVNILKAAYEQSKQVCKKRYEKLVVDEESYMSVYRKGKRYFDNRQLFALKAMYLWRDKTARELDESLVYVFPDNMMLNVAENLPREVQGILACCNPVPPLVKANLLEIHYLILRAKEQPLVMVIPDSTSGQVNAVKAVGATAEQHLLDQWYHPMNEFRDDLPTLLADSGANNKDEDSDDGSDSDLTPQLSIFLKKDKCTADGSSDASVDPEVLERLKGLNFVSPYQRYVKVLPYSAQLEKELKEAEDKAAEEHRTRSRQQQALTMEIKSLQESGLIKLKKENDEEGPLKMQLAQERKRRSGEGQKDVPNKMARRQNRKKLKKEDGNLNEADPICTPSSSIDKQPELRDFKEETASDETCTTGNLDQENETDKTANLSASHMERTQPNAGTRPRNWKELNELKKTQGNENFKPYDYSKIDYNKKFFSGNQPSNSNALGKKKKWKNNPGALKFSKRKQKKGKLI